MNRTRVTIDTIARSTNRIIYTPLEHFLCSKTFIILILFFLHLFTVYLHFSDGFSDKLKQ